MPQLKKLFFFCLLLSFACSKDKITIEFIEHDSNTSHTLAAVHFLDETHGYAVGGDSWYYGVLAQTHDGGTTWQADSLCDGFLWDLAVDQNDHLYTTGIHANLLDLQEDSTKWNATRLPFWEIMRGVAFWDNQQGILVGGAAFHTGYIAKIKTDFQLDTLLEIDHDLNTVCFSEATIAHAVGYGAVLRSQDAGLTWEQANVQGDNFRSVCFPTPNIGYVVGSVGMILKTTDGGNSWQILRDGDAIGVKDIPFRAVFFKNNTQGYIVGDKGTFWKTIDGGTTWQIVEGLPNINLYDIFVVNNTGWIVGENGAIFSFEE